jgi:hypothetical protein
MQKNSNYGGASQVSLYMRKKYSLLKMKLPFIHWLICEAEEGECSGNMSAEYWLVEYRP